MNANMDYCNGAFFPSSQMSHQDHFSEIGEKKFGGIYKRMKSKGRFILTDDAAN